MILWSFLGYVLEQSIFDEFVKRCEDLWKKRLATTYMFICLGAENLQSLRCIRASIMRVCLLQVILLYCRGP